MRLTGILALIGFALNSCTSAPDPQILIASQERIAECGGGLSLSSAVIGTTTKLAAGRRLTLELRKSLEGAFLQHLSTEPSQAEATFGLYIDCINGLVSLSQMSAMIANRIPIMRRELAQQNVPEATIAELEGLARQEPKLILDRRFVEARELRGLITRRAMEAVIQAGGSVLGLGWNYTMEFRSETTVRKYRTNEWISLRIELMRACSLFVLARECEIQIGEVVRRARAIEEPCMKPGGAGDMHACLRELYQKPSDLR